MTDRNEFIDTARQIIMTTPINERDRLIWQHELGSALQKRCEDEGTADDIDEAIRVGQEALDLAPDDYAHRAVLLDALGMRLTIRFTITGQLVDLEYAIEVSRQALNQAPGPSFNRSAGLAHLSNHLMVRYERNGSSVDLQEAIDSAQLAVDMTPIDEPHRAIRLMTLINSLHERYSNTGNMKDLNKVIEISRGLIRSTPEDLIPQALLQSQLSIYIGDRYVRTQDMDDVDEAIQLAQEAVNQLTHGHSRASNILNCLIIGLAKRYAILRTPRDVEEAIKHGQYAITIAHPGDPALANYMCNLAECYWNRYTLGNCKDDFNQAVTIYQAALSHSNSAISSRFAAGKALFDIFAHTLNWEEALNIWHFTFSLLPYLAPRSLSFTDKQRTLHRMLDLACDATAVAFQTGQSALSALRILENGRGVLASTTEQIRADILDLEETHPDLARQFLQLRQVLDAPIDDSNLASAQAATKHKTEASLEFDKLIDDIRKQPGLNNFLDSPTEDEIRTAASLGPVVVINLSQFRCDAILIEQQNIRSLALPNLSVEKLDEKERDGSATDTAILEWFWDVAACPILHSLDINGPPLNGNWPHIWWIPTGRLSTYPFHAFGHHYPGSTETVLDRVVSSYSSSVQALVNSGKRRSHHSTEDKAVLVAMQDTVGQSQLPFVELEVSTIQKLFASTSLELCIPERRKQVVLESLKDCKIFHFAGHGKTDRDPSQGGLFLDDAILTVSDLMDINLRKQAPFLAYLSACGTGRIGAHFVNENIHLISACQLAGFRHVIGTLWEVNDESCVEVSRIVYESIRDGLFTDSSVSQGLHKAMTELRNKWLKASEHLGQSLPSGSQCGGSWPRDIVTCDGEDEKMGKLLWVPFVHVGV